MSEDCLPSRDAGESTSPSPVIADLPGPPPPPPPQAPQHFELLLQLGDLLGSLLDYQAVLDTLVHFLVPRLADWCVIDIPDAEGIPRPVAIAHVEPEKVALAHELRRRYPLRLNEPQGLAHAIRSGKAELHAEVLDAALVVACEDEEQLRMVRDLGMRSAMVVPMTAHGTTVGAISFVSVGGARRYDESDLALAVALGARAAVALENARLHGLVQAHARRARMLADAGATLASLLDYDTASDTIARLIVPAMADCCIIDLFDAAGAVTESVVAHRDPAQAVLHRELRHRYPQSPNDPRSESRRTATARILPIVDEDVLRQVAYDDEHLRALRVLAPRSVVLVPLIAHGDAIGFMQVGLFERTFILDDLALFEELGARVALAINTARAHRAERAARQQAEQVALRMTRLQFLTLVLADATTPEQVAAIIVKHAVHATSAERGVVLVLSRDERFLEIAATLNIDPAVIEKYRTIPVESALAAAVIFRRREADFLSTPEHFRARYPGSALLLGEALIGLPLIGAEGRTNGVFILGFDSAPGFSPQQRAFVLTLARLGAQALERTRLHAAEHHARLAAEAANRAKDEFLGVVSHELRAPLTAIRGWTSILLASEKDRATTEKGLRVIERNARAQNKIIDDLLDVSRIIAGKLRFEARPVDLGGVLLAACEIIRPTATSKAVELVLQIAADVPLVAGDPDRLQQVFWNLLSNAVKFTPQGGRIDVGLERASSGVRVTVADTGAGIESAFLPFVFDRFRQADSSPTRRHGGLGLGLAIVRHLVELHAGSVGVESKGLAHGSRFTVDLPLPAVSSRIQERPSTRPPAGSPLSEAPHVSSLDGVRVLVVDDEHDAREIIAAVLTSYGAAVCEAVSAEAALGVFDGFRPDVLVSDIGMPDEDGFSLIARIRALRSSRAPIPALALTGYAGEADARRALRAGFQAHLAKPVDPAVLAAVIAKLVAGPGRGV